MTKSLSTLVSDVYQLLEQNKLTDASLIDRYAEQVGEVLLKRFNREGKSPTLRMSNLGKP